MPRSRGPPGEKRHHDAELPAETAAGLALFVAPRRRALRVGHAGGVSGRGAAVEVDARLAIVVDAVLALGVLERPQRIAAARIVGDVGEAVAVVVEAVVADEGGGRLEKVGRARAARIREGVDEAVAVVVDGVLALVLDLTGGRAAVIGDEVAVVALLVRDPSMPVAAGRHRLELPHHLVILLLEVVAGVREAAREILEAGDYAQDLVGPHLDGVLPAGLVERRRNGRADGHDG